MGLTQPGWEKEKVGIRVLGELALEVGGRQSEGIASHRARSLLGWLAVHPGLHPRGRVAGEFWPEVLEDSARSSLRTTLATLRRELGNSAADVVTATRERVGIKPGPEAWIDLQAFERLVSQGELERAAALCRGDLLADLDDDWVNEPREHHRHRLLGVLGQLAEEAERSGDLKGALDRTREQVSLDPLSEEAQRELVRRLAATGDRAGALAAYKAYGARLRRDLGLAPSAGIRELAEDVRSGSSQPAGNGAGPGAPERTPVEFHYARCADCGHENAPDRRFCGSCGHALFQACPSCGEENSSPVDYCGACGSELVPTARVAAALEGERRWATVLFGDLAGFTHLSETRDPEDVRLMVDRCTSQMGEIVDRYGGWIDKVMGDALMAVFGAPVAHEDDAERAVRAGLELQRYATENADDLGGLALRVGVDSGEVMFAPVGPADRREPTVTGDTVNTAWRLQEVAPQGSVLIGDQTRCACRKGIRCEALSPITVKGKDAPVAAWIAKEPLGSSAREMVSSTPMLGRAAELELLRSTWERVVDMRQPQLVTVLGTAGVGKTRLCHELVRCVEERGDRVVRGRSLPYGESTGYGALATMIRSVAGIFETDPPHEAEEKLGRRVEALIDVGDPRTVLAHLSLLAGLTEGAVDERSELFASAREFFEALGRERATLFVFEDVHWANPSLLDLIESVAAHVREVPAMFLTLARGELLDARPSWGGGIPRHTGVSLEPLATDDAHELALRSLRDVPEPEAAAERIEQAAGGNPLFIEELTAAMAEGAADAAQELPVAIRATISARLDALPVEERRLLLDASVVGNTFWRGAVERLAGDELSVVPALEDLEFREMIRRRRVSRMQGDDEFSFKHELIRDVAYGTLPRAARRERHAVVAGFLEEEAGSGADTAAILAHHWREAGDSERAVAYLLSAAELAGRGWATAEAIDLYNRALELIPEDDESRRREVELKRALAYAIFTHIVDAQKTPRS
jgi:class 3 adenylate cyclase/DNA-binding SARP family transcriptional activator/tetratricopeptide (TPR) repeat protein